MAAELKAARIKAACYGDGDITMFSVPDHPKEGGLVAVLRGSILKAKPILLLAHLDVVEAKREDWTRDPFGFIEENGFFIAPIVLKQVHMRWGLVEPAQFCKTAPLVVVASLSSIPAEPGGPVPPGTVIP